MKLPLPTDNPYYLLFGGVAAALLLASTIGLLMRHFVARGQPHAVIDNLVARVNAWWWMVGILAFSFWLGREAVIVLFALLSFFALREFLTITDTRRGDHHALLASFFLCLPVQYWLLHIDWYGLFAILLPVYGFLLLPILAALSGDPKRFLTRTATIQWGVMVAVYCLSHLPALMNLRIPGYEGKGMLLIAYLVLVVQGSDVLQYVWGKLLGRHKLSPTLSPSKTWEGLIGGVLSATALGSALHGLTPFSALEAAGLSFCACVMGFFGGLVLSAIKRDRGIKDWGHLIEGHGGMLDRLDSLCFSAPIFFHLVRYYWT
jgi:phosphatidate cytidylyltransferase